MRVHVAGVALRGSGYPNAEQTISLLRQTGRYQIDDHAEWLPPDARLWRLLGSGWIERMSTLAQLVFRGGRQAVSILARAGTDDWVYIPYPAPFTLWWLSFVPERIRPRCAADAYISLWDSLIRDRAREKKRSFVFRAMYHAERRALRSAYRIITDTTSNSWQISTDFGIPAHKLRAFPLAVNAAPFLSLRSDKAKRAEPLTVLFFGTFIPLHGIECVLGAIEALSQDERFRFQLIGDGQQNGAVEEFFQSAERQNAIWRRAWLNLEELAKAVSDADICLGVFGGDGKAARVLPFKAYYALAAGKPMVTQRQLSFPDDVPTPPFSWVDGDAPHDRVNSLVERLKELAEDPELRFSLGGESGRYYDTYLSGEAVRARWTALFEEEDSHCP